MLAGQGACPCVRACVWLRGSSDLKTVREREGEECVLTVQHGTHEEEDDDVCQHSMCVCASVCVRVTVTELTYVNECNCETVCCM